MTNIEKIEQNLMRSLAIILYIMETNGPVSLKPLKKCKLFVGIANAMGVFPNLQKNRK